MTPSLTFRAACSFAVILLAFTSLASAQVPFNRDTIVLDPAHGGPNIGTQINDHTLEKDITLALAVRIRSLLVARGFKVILTRENDVALSADQRAELANRAHPVACLVLHATASGTGVHLATSTLNPILTVESNAPIPWDNAQAVFLPQSQNLSAQIATAVNRSRIPVVQGRAALRPLDNLMCPSLSVELGPLVLSGSDPTPITDPGYQQRVGEAVAGALIFWRNLAQPPAYAPARTVPLAHSAAKPVETP